MQLYDNYNCIFTIRTNSKLEITVMYLSSVVQVYSCTDDFFHDTKVNLLQSDIKDNMTVISETGYSEIVFNPGKHWGYEYNHIKDLMYQ